VTSTSILHSDDTVSWDATLALCSEQLRFYLDYLLECDCSCELLASVEAAVKNRTVPDRFKQRFLVRVMVEKVIEHSRERAHSPDPMHAKLEFGVVSANRAPILERLIYFMRDILEYSTRETSLLIGITDFHVERLLNIVRKRIDMNEGPSAISIEKPDGAYFRWRMDQLL